MAHTVNASTLTAPAPAKINLFLHVVGRRPDDGYHLLESAMVLLDFGDTLHFTLRDDAQIRLIAGTPGVNPADDLCMRAAHALHPYAHANAGVDMALEKRIPMGAGLGGGSSDAATVLLVLNRLWRCHLPRTTLMQIGLTLGADVPFFIFGQNAFARGIGECLTALTVPSAQIVLVKPDAHAATPRIFAQPDLVRNTPLLTLEAMPFAAGRNDLQPVAERLLPEIATARHALSPHARMTGSGAAVFAQTNAANRAAATQHWHQVTRIIPRHPLLDFADKP